jgi:protein-S-isoprenylcysteine O-methyltransferase Ste14
MLEPWSSLSHRIVHSLGRTPVATFFLCPVVVLSFELALHRGRPAFVPWGLAPCAWGYLQYLLVGCYRLPLAGGSSGMDVEPQRLVTHGPYRYTRNPMYLGHLIFLLGLALTFWSWFAVILLIGRTGWFHRRVLGDEARLGKIFGDEYAAYRVRVKRWIPWVV